jgi:hypothetical protein
MAAENVAFLFASRPRSRDWTSQELAEFYRVESALIQGGMKISTDRGVSDEGDPWFVFCREEGGDPVVHFARIDGQYIIASPAYKGVARGLDFRSMVQDLISRHKLAPVNKEQKSNIFMHPAALLVIVVGTAFFKSPGEARADELRKDAAPKTADGSSDAITHNGRKFALEGDSVSLSTIDDKLELAQNMSQLLIVAASAALAADADQSLSQTKTSAAFFPSEPWWYDGESDGYGVASHHQPIVHLNSDGFEIAANDQAATVVTQPLASSSAGFGDVVSSALKLTTDLNGISSTHPGNSSEHAYLFIKDNNMSPVASSFNNEAGFLAQKSAAASTVGTETSSTQIAGVLHVNASTSELNGLQGNSFYENGTIIYQLPTGLTSVTPLASVATQVGNADNFLAGNNIFIDLHQATSISTDSTGLLASVKQVTTDASSSTNNHASATTPTTSTTPSTVSAPTPVDITTGNAIVSTTSSTEAITSTVFLKTLDLFMVDTPALGVYYSNDHYLFYNAADVTSKAAHLESVSMTFTDGSSISIVGQVQFLSNIIAHAQ